MKPQHLASVMHSEVRPNPQEVLANHIIPSTVNLNFSILDQNRPEVEHVRMLPFVLLDYEIIPALFVPLFYSIRV